MEKAIASYVEQDCTFEHAGRKFEAGGAVVTDKFITAYLKAMCSWSSHEHSGILTDWHGKQIGTYRVLSSWPIHSFITDRMYSVECFVNGVRYVGRSAGAGMAINAKRSPKQ
jgi:hypothetical protein